MNHTLIIRKRLEKVKRIIAVAGAKGGVGKSSVSAVLSLILSKQGKKTGLLDLDFTCPSSHILLGAKDIFPKEELGLIPPKASGVKFMSLVFFSKEQPLALRGDSQTKALSELLAVTLWGELDYLIIDTPPGMSNILLDLARYIKNIEFLIVSTGSPLSVSVSGALANILKEMKIPIVSRIENMGKDVSYDAEFEKAIGNPEKLLFSKFAKDLEKIAERLEKS
ncbi:MAG: P-loop NTPase [Candidatus Woesearchaeota archaeon]